MLVNVSDMTEEAAKDLLSKIISNLDEMDEDDFFGTEGWKQYMGFED